MLRITREDQNGAVTYHLAGTIDETTDLEKLLAGIPAASIVNCRKIERINSAGVRTWLKFFRSLTQRGLQFRLVECSPAIVEQLNVIKNFSCGGEVVSVFLPFACVPCRTQFVQLIAVERLRAIYKNLPTPKCPKCGCPALFDEIEQEYFNFLSVA